MKLLAILTGLALITSPATAATIEVFNGDIEAPFVPNALSDANGDFALGIEGFQINGVGGAFEFASNVFTNAPAAVGDQVGFLLNGATAFQLLDVEIQANAQYILSSLFANRADFAEGISGTIGLFAGDINNVIASIEITDGGEDTFTLQTLSAIIDSTSSFVGEQLGFFITSTSRQLNFDNISLEEILAATGDPVVTPLPAAAWLFGSVLMAGGLASRKRKTS